MDAPVTVRARAKSERGRHMADQQALGVAFVTGASRGIGKAIAIELAEAGYDVAILARTVHEGERREHSSTLNRSDTSALPGSLDETAARIEAAGRRCLAIPGDLLDHPSLVHAVASVLAVWGRVDVLVNNGRYIGPGHMDHIVDTPVRVLRDHLEANALAPVVLIKEVLPGMIDRGAARSSTSRRALRSRIPPRPPARAVGDSGTRSARARSTESRESCGSRWPTRACERSTCNPGSSPPSEWCRTWPRSGSTRRRARRSRWSPRCVAGCWNRPTPTRATARTSKPSRCAASSACSPGGRSRRAEHSAVAAPVRGSV